MVSTREKIVNSDQTQKQTAVFRALYELAKQSVNIKLESTAFICVQHELTATICLFEMLIALGAKPGRIFIVGKHYSSCQHVGSTLEGMGIKRFSSTQDHAPGEFFEAINYDVKALWHSFCGKIEADAGIKNLIILDDGGRCSAAIPEAVFEKMPVFAIEQTTRGLNNTTTFELPFPIIQVAASAAKVILESPIIANAAITDQLSEYLQSINHNSVCGVVGIGNIGLAVARKLLSLGYKLHVFDAKKCLPDSLIDAVKESSLEDLFQHADHIFSCTGYDVVNDLDLALLEGYKHLYSCSSEDIEFQSLLTSRPDILTNNRLDDIIIRLSEKATIQLHRGGFPITFNNLPTPAPLVDIQLTQGLLLGAVFQAILAMPGSAIGNKKTRVMLDPLIQSYVSQQWFAIQHTNKGLGINSQNFLDLSWIKYHSGGLYTPSKSIYEIFASPSYHATELA